MNLEGLLALWIVLGVVAAIVVLFAYLFSIKLFIDAIRAKGYAAKSTALLWVIGIIMTPVIVGLYAAALPDNRG